MLRLAIHTLQQLAIVEKGDNRNSKVRKEASDGDAVEAGWFDSSCRHLIQWDRGERLSGLSLERAESLPRRAKDHCDPRLVSPGILGCAKGQAEGKWSVYLFGGTSGCLRSLL